MQQEDVLDLLRGSGRALHGERWQVPLSRDLGVTDQALRYWLDGANAVPIDDVLPKLLQTLKLKASDLNTIISDIQKAIDA